MARAVREGPFSQLFASGSLRAPFLGARKLPLAEAQEYLVSVVQPLQFACANTPPDPQINPESAATICIPAYYAASNHQDMVESCWSDYGICTAEAREEESDCIQSQCVGLGGDNVERHVPPKLTPGLIVLQMILLVLLSLVFAWVVWGQEPVADGPSFPLHDALAQENYD